jgi:UDP-GlcNAc:undecaprenyl-phosphate GlcNAc-1-phosphate transferase
VVGEFGVSALATVVLLLVLHPIARKLGLFDHPSGRKNHDEPTANIGGLAMAGAIFVVMAWFTALSGASIAFMIAAGLLVLIGALDDRYDLRWWMRMLAQCVAVLVMIYVGGLRIEHVGPLFGVSSTGLGIFSVPFTMFATVGVINAINMSDGVDGLAGSISLAALCMLDAAALYSGNDVLAERLAVFAGAVLGFLLMNMRFPWQPHARVFMGDAGSSFLGFIIAWGSFRLTQNWSHPVTPILAPWLLATPLIDCVTLIARRLAHGQSPFRADRGHMHHLMLDAGFTPTQLTLTLTAINLALGFCAAIMLKLKLPQPLLVLVFIAVCLWYFRLTARRERAVAAFAGLGRLLTRLHLKTANDAST